MVFGRLQIKQGVPVVPPTSVRPPAESLHCVAAPRLDLQSIEAAEGRFLASNFSSRKGPNLAMAFSTASTSTVAIWECVAIP